MCLHVKNRFSIHYFEKISATVYKLYIIHFIQPQQLRLPTSPVNKAATKLPVIVTILTAGNRALQINLNSYLKLTQDSYKTLTYIPITSKSVIWCSSKLQRKHVPVL